MSYPPKVDMWIRKRCDNLEVGTENSVPSSVMYNTAVSLLQRYLDSCPEKERFPYYIIAPTCCWIAVKYHSDDNYYCVSEVTEHVPAEDTQPVLKAEIQILQLVNWRICPQNNKDVLSLSEAPNTSSHPTPS